MKQHIILSMLVTLFLTGVNCKDEPLPPCTDCPQPVDTTSHDFTFYVDTLGDGNSSVLFDVAIINESLIYAVGEIYSKDSTGEINMQAYNLVKFQGSDIKLSKIQFYTFCGQQNTGSYPASALFVQDSSKIWISSNSQIAFWNGITQTGIICIPVSVNKIWSNFGNLTYTAGPLGQIGFYNGTTWQKISTGTTFDFKDIWGDKNPTTGEYEIYAVASKGSFSTEKKIYRIQGTAATEVSIDGIPYSTNCIWFKSQKQYYVAGGGMWKKESITSNTPWLSFESGITPYYIYGMRGQSENDIVAVGSFGELLHYNGKSWKSFRDLPGFNNLELYAVDIKGDVICAVGYIGSRACVVRGYRK